MQTIRRARRALAALALPLALFTASAAQALTLECRSESITPAKDADKASAPAQSVGRKFDMQIGMNSANHEWKTTDKRYIRDFVMGNVRNTEFWVDRETGAYWLLVYKVSWAGNPRAVKSIERYYEYTGTCTAKEVAPKF
jgi:hypothetical protein